MNTLCNRIKLLIFSMTLFLLAGRLLPAATVTVEVATRDNVIRYNPPTVQIQPGDTVEWVWTAPFYHSVTSGTPGHPNGLFNSGIVRSGPYSFTFTEPGTYDYYCFLHGHEGHVGEVIVEGEARPPSEGQLLNISTRLKVQNGDNVLIGGFIVTGDEPKKVLLRAIGPSLEDQGVAGALSDPILELHGSDGSLIVSNNDWRSTQEEEIEATGAAPTNDLESAILATLEPDNYTAIVKGNNGMTGIGLVEGYDLDPAADSQLANISTRGFVETGEGVMIGGFILGNASGNTNVLIRALGTTLADFGITDTLADPVLDLYDENGSLVMSNDNWQDTQHVEIVAAGNPPGNYFESAMIAILPATPHTAIVSGKDGGTGVALVEAYRLP